HMPMEPSGYFLRLEKDTVTTGMGEEEIASIFLKALSGVPGVMGVSNHMGSRFTADSKKMNIFLKQVKKKRLFFYDAVACKDSVCEETASELKVKFIKRDVFLDGVHNINYIKGQLQKLIEIAKKRGYAVGTGHDRVKTLEVIKELAPALKDKVRFVFVSELAK
ncbi:MAG: divergent polysaccharide deacetylase family protein, partial [Candidatus Omnitrophota bacterium]